MGHDVAPRFGRAPEPQVQWEVPPPPAELTRYVLRIELTGSEPVVWRRVEVASNLAMDVLHEVVQEAMGWQDCHLHAFVHGSADDYGAPRLLTEADTDEGEDGAQEVDVRLDQVLREPGQRIGYEYDFGDSWSHEITLEDVRPHDPMAAQAVCLDGARACPPEDVGGISSHNVVVAWLNGQPGVEPDEPELTRQWLPEGYDPAWFSPAKATARLTLTRAGAALSHLDLGGPVLDMLARLGSSRPLLVAMLHDAFGGPTRAASSADPLAELTDDQTAAAARAWTVLLEQIPAHGLRLTSAGYLPPRVVSTIYRTLDLDREWIGAGTREDLTVPVLALREYAVRLGLLRKVRSSLHRTAAGQAGLAEPRLLLHHILGRLPFGFSDSQRDAGLLALLVAAGAGGTANDGMDQATTVFAALGWRPENGESPTTDEVKGIMRPTHDILRRCGVFESQDRYWRVEQISSYGAQLARAALLAEVLPSPRPSDAPAPVVRSP